MNQRGRHERAPLPPVEEGKGSERILVEPPELSKPEAPPAPPAPETTKPLNTSRISGVLPTESAAPVRELNLRDVSDSSLAGGSEEASELTRILNAGLEGSPEQVVPEE